MSAEKEGRVERYLVLRVGQLGGQALKFTSPGKNGVPDRVIFAPGRPTVFVEVKAPGERLRPLQEAVIADMVRHGARVAVVYSEASVEEMLREWI
jgi:Holliday junction resolvase